MKHITLVILILGGFAASAQQGNVMDRLYFSGGAGLSISDNYTNVSLFPQVGYKITDAYSAGVGVIYQYVQIGDFSVSNYGGSIFNRFQVTDGFFLYGEYERLNFEYFTTANTEETERSGYNSLLLGGGYSEYLGGNVSFNLTVLYNVLYDELEVPKPYNSPLVIRAGIGVGIF